MFRLFESKDIIIINNCIYILIFIIICVFVVLGWLKFKEWIVKKCTTCTNIICNNDNNNSDGFAVNVIECRVKPPPKYEDIEFELPPPTYEELYLSPNNLLLKNP